MLDLFLKERGLSDYMRGLQDKERSEGLELEESQLDFDNPVHLKIAMCMAQLCLENYISEGHTFLTVAPDGAKVTLPFVAKVVGKFADAI